MAAQSKYLWYRGQNWNKGNKHPNWIAKNDRGDKMGETNSGWNTNHMKLSAEDQNPVGCAEYRASTYDSAYWNVMDDQSLWYFNWIRATSRHGEIRVSGMMFYDYVRKRDHTWDATNSRNDM